MPGIARRGDRISGGAHCHGHPHGPIPTPGLIKEGSSKVHVDGRPAARAGDAGHSPLCCGAIGTIQILPQPGRVFVDGRPVAVSGNPTLHCGMGSGSVASASGKVIVR